MAVRSRLIVVAGPNGSGKTSITEAVLRHPWMRGCVRVNPDNIARDELGDWNSPERCFRASDGELSKRYRDTPAWAKEIEQSMRGR